MLTIPLLSIVPEHKWAELCYPIEQSIEERIHRRSTKRRRLTTMSRPSTPEVPKEESHSSDDLPSPEVISNGSLEPVSLSAEGSPFSYLGRRSSVDANIDLPDKDRQTELAEDIVLGSASESDALTTQVEEDEQERILQEAWLKCRNGIDVEPLGLRSLALEDTTALRIMDLMRDQHSHIEPDQKRPSGEFLDRLWQCSTWDDPKSNDVGKGETSFDHHYAQRLYNSPSIVFNHHVNGASFIDLCIRCHLIIFILFRLCSVVDFALHHHSEPIAPFDRKTRQRRALTTIQHKQSNFLKLLDHLQFPYSVHEALLDPTPQALDHISNHLARAFFDRLDAIYATCRCCGASPSLGKPSSLWESIARPWVEAETSVDRAKLVLLLADLSGVLKGGGESPTKCDFGKSLNGSLARGGLTERVERVNTRTTIDDGLYDC